MTDKKKILIAEDDTFLQGLVSSKLGKSGFEVMVANNGKDAIKLSDENTPDIILLDLVMPGTDGFAALEKIRKSSATKKTPIIVFSNLAEAKDIERARELGANEFMIKSNFTLDELVDKINEFVKAGQGLK